MENVTVRFRDGFQGKNETMVRSLGRESYRELPLIGGAAYREPPEAVARLRAKPAVKAVRRTGAWPGR